MKNRGYYGGLYLLPFFYFGYLVGDYFTGNRRYGANTLVGNMYNNNNFIINKE
jgi:hypothetical protein